MTSRLTTAAIAALTLAGSLPAVGTAFAQDHHNGGQHDGGNRGGGNHGGGGHDGGNRGGYHGGGHSYGGRGGNYRGGGYHRGGGGGLAAGLALGAVLGSYQGRPYYCREHRHWSPYYGRYVGGAC